MPDAARAGGGDGAGLHHQDRGSALFPNPVSGRRPLCRPSPKLLGAQGCPHPPQTSLSHLPLPSRCARQDGDEDDDDPICIQDAGSFEPSARGNYFRDGATKIGEQPPAPLLRGIVPWGTCLGDVALLGGDGPQVPAGWVGARVLGGPSPTLGPTLEPLAVLHRLRAGLGGEAAPPKEEEGQAAPVRGAAAGAPRAMEEEVPEKPARRRAAHGEGETAAPGGPPPRVRRAPGPGCTCLGAPAQLPPSTPRRRRR